MLCVNGMHSTSHTSPIVWCPSYRDMKMWGLTWGVTHFAALSNGEFIDHPHYFRKAEKKLAYVHRHKEVQHA